MTQPWQLWLLWGVRDRHGHGRAGAGLRRHRRQPLVRLAPRPRHRYLLGGQLHRPAGLPAGDRPARRTARAGAGPPASSQSSRCCSCRSSGRSCATGRRHRPTAYGAAEPLVRRPPADPGASPARARHPARERRAAGRSGSSSCTFWICGWSTNGLIGTHFIPAAHDHGMPADDQRRAARADRRLRHRRHHRHRLADRPGRLPLPALRLLLLPRALAARRTRAARARTCTRACSSSSCSTAWTGSRPCHPPSRCAASTSASSGQASSSAGCSRRTWWVPASPRASPAGSASGVGDYFGAWLTAGGLCLLAAGRLPDDPASGRSPRWSEPQPGLFEQRLDPQPLGLAVGAERQLGGVGQAEGPHAWASASSYAACVATRRTWLVPGGDEEHRCSAALRSAAIASIGGPAAWPAAAGAGARRSWQPSRRTHPSTRPASR